MGGIKPDLDPFAKYDRPDDDPFAKYDTPAKAALAKDTFAGPSFSIPGLAEAVAPRVQPNVVPPRPISAQDLLNFTPTEAPRVPRETVASQVLAKEAATRAAVEEAGRQLPVAGLPGVRLGMAEDASNVLRAVPGGVAGGLRMAGGGFVDMGAKAAGLPEPFRALEATARRVEGPEGLATGTGRMVGTLAGMAPVYSALGIAAGRAAPTSFLGKVGAALEGEAFLPRAAANFGVGAPIDIASGIIEGQDTGNTAGAVARNLAYGALGAGGFEGVRQPFIAKGGVKSATQAGDLYDALKSRLDATDAPLAQEMAGVVPEQVQRPASQLQKPGNPIYENPEPIAEARAANPLTDTDPARGLARDIEASPAAALPPEVYAGPDRRMRIESVSADDILNRHRRATDLPPTTAPLAPRVQTGRPRTTTADPALQGVTRFEQAPVRPQADETAVLERLAMQERSAASELAAKELGAPPQMEGAVRILPMPGTKGRIKWEGGHKDFQYTGTDALARQYLDTIDRASEGSAAELAGRRDWAREQGDGTIHSSGFGTMESGRGRAQMNQAARSLDKIEAELRGRGVDVEALRSGEMAPPPLSTDAKLSKQDAARERSRVAKEKRVAKAAEAERLRVEGPDEVQASGDTLLPQNYDVGLYERLQSESDRVNRRPYMPLEPSELEALQQSGLVKKGRKGGLTPEGQSKLYELRRENEAWRLAEGDRADAAADRAFDAQQATNDATAAHLAESESPSLVNKRKGKRGELGALGMSGGPGFTSRLVESAKRIKLEKAPAQTWISKLRGNASSGDEFDWALGDALKADPKRQWTKAEIIAMAEQRGYGALTETVRSSSAPEVAPTLTAHDNGFRVHDPMTDYEVVFPDAEMGAARSVRNMMKSTDPQKLRVESRQLERVAKEMQASYKAGKQFSKTPEASINARFDAAAALEARADALELGRANGTVKPTKFSAYTEPGGENYREVLLRVPERTTNAVSMETEGRAQALYESSASPFSDPLDPWEALPQEQRNYWLDKVDKGAPDQPFRGSHWDEPNVLAHIRMNDRVGPNGEKVLHVEELQSDWHQKGRREGYQSAEPVDPAKIARAKQAMDDLTIKYNVERQRLGQEMGEDWRSNRVAARPELQNIKTEYELAVDDYERLTSKIRSGVPDAPFKETPEWMGLAMKRVLDEAVAGGYDAVSWTPGVKQADRYSLRKVAEWIGYEPSTGKLLADDAAQNSVHRGHYAPEALPDVIGKEAADRLLASPLNKDGMHEISGEQLEIGGEGMKAFYDQMLPDWLRAYGKKLGVKVEIGTSGEPKPVLFTKQMAKAMERDYTVGGMNDAAIITHRLASQIGDGLPLEDVTAILGRMDGEPASWRANVRNSVREVLENTRPEGGFPQFRITPELRAAIGKGQNYGKGGTPVLTGLAGSGVGGAVGYATGSTPEERKRNALLGAAVGLGAGAGLGALAERLGQRGAKGVTSSPAAMQVLSTIATDSRASPRPWLSLAERLKVRLQDESYPLSKLGQELGGTLDLRDLVSQSKGWRGMATQYNADHLVPVLEAAKGIEGEVAAYAKSQRALQLMDQGRPMEGGFGRDVYEQAVADLGQNPKVVAAAQQLQDYYRGLLDLKHQEGVLTDEAYQAIVASEDFYTPFAHDIGDAKPSAGGGRWFNRGTGVKKMDRAQGTTGQTRDPFLMAVLHTAETHRQVAKQRVTNMVAALVEADPQAASSLLREIPANTPAREGTTVKANVGGKQKTYEVLDADLYNAWAAMDPPQQNIVVSLLRPFKTALTAGVTALPDFMVANVIRDNAMTAIQKSAPWKSSAAGAAIGAGVGASVSEDKVKGALIGAGVGTGLGAVVPNLGRTLLSMKAILGNDEIYQQFLRDGGDNFGYYPRNTADAAKVLKELQKHGVSATDIINPAQWVKGAWGGMKALNRAAEQGPRLRAYQDALTAGASKAKAVHAARDISVDFSTLGGGTKGLAATTAFWNAGVQGWEKTIRLMRNPKTYAMAAATITAPSVALWALNHEREDYKKVQQWERNLFWLVPKGEDGEGFWRIPKPFEVGFVFGSVPERILDYLQARADGGDPDAAKTLKQTLTSMATTSGSGLIPFPTGAEQIVSQIAGKGGYDFFREQPIVWRPDVPDEEQYDERTSSLAYGLGQATGISPQRTDFAAKSMFGGSAKVVLDATDIIARKMGWDTRPLPDGVRNPLTRRFSTNPNAQPEQERALRQRAREIDQVEAGLRKVQATGTPEAQRRYIERHRDALEVNAKGKARLKRELRDVQREVDRLNTARDRAKRDAR